jgi:hypothetical protein
VNNATKLQSGFRRSSRIVGSQIGSHAVVRGSERV